MSPLAVWPLENSTVHSWDNKSDKSKQQINMMKIVLILQILQESEITLWKLLF